MYYSVIGIVFYKMPVLINTFSLMDSQVRRCPGFRGEKGNTGALCADTEDHPISFRRQTPRPRCTEAQVRRSIKVAVSQKVQKYKE